MAEQRPLEIGSSLMQCSSWLCDRRACCNTWKKAWNGADDRLMGTKYVSEYMQDHAEERQEPGEVPLGQRLPVARVLIQFRRAWLAGVSFVVLLNRSAKSASNYSLGLSIQVPRD